MSKNRSTFESLTGLEFEGTSRDLLNKVRYELQYSDMTVWTRKRMEVLRDKLLKQRQI
jgi:hypothetical protein